MKLWLVVVKDKELEGEPDVGFVVIEGNELAATAAMKEMEVACIKAGRGRCVGRYREILRGKQYNATALIRTARATPLSPCMCSDREVRSSYRVGDMVHGRCACGGAFTVAASA